MFGDGAVGERMDGWPLPATETVNGKRVGKLFPRATWEGALDLPDATNIATSLHVDASVHPKIDHTTIQHRANQVLALIKRRNVFTRTTKPTADIGGESGASIIRHPTPKLSISTQVRRD